MTPRSAAKPRPSDRLVPLLLRFCPQETWPLVERAFALAREQGASSPVSAFLDICKEFTTVYGAAAAPPKGEDR